MSSDCHNDKNFLGECPTNMQIKVKSSKGDKKNLDEVKNHPEEREAEDHVSRRHCNVYLKIILITTDQNHNKQLPVQ